MSVLIWLVVGWHRIGCFAARIPLSAQAFHFTMQIWNSSGILVRFLRIAVWLLARMVILCDSILAPNMTNCRGCNYKWHMSVFFECVADEATKTHPIFLYSNLLCFVLCCFISGRIFGMRAFATIFFALKRTPDTTCRDNLLEANVHVAH